MLDVSQFENVILNLCINGRDAIAGKGEIIIDIRSAEVDGRRCHWYRGAGVGAYVRVSISDSGSGMSEETMERALEPFFTTKPSGMGTGLGLSMAYGFIEQSGGHLELRSKLGCGTTVTMHFPQVSRPTN